MDVVLNILVLFYINAQLFLSSIRLGLQHVFIKIKTYNININYCWLLDTNGLSVSSVIRRRRINIKRFACSLCISSIYT